MDFKFSIYYLMDNNLTHSTNRAITALYQMYYHLVTGNLFTLPFYIFFTILETLQMIYYYFYSHIAHPLFARFNQYFSYVMVYSLQAYAANNHLL